MNEKQKGRVTVPTDVDMIEETKQIVERWGGRRDSRLRWNQYARGAKKDAR